MKEYKVSAVGQISMPAEARRNWGIYDGGRVRVADLNEGILMIPDGTEFAMIEHYYPESELKERATVKLKNYQYNQANTSTPKEVFNSYKISRSGQTVLPAAALHRWNLDNGGIVNVTSFQEALIITPRIIDIAELLPEKLYSESDWQYNRDGLLSRFLLDAYAEWTRESGEKIIDAVTFGSPFPGFKRDNTALGRTITRIVVKDALGSAFKQALSN